jgi:mono/diheme cytochrome c family protein
MNIRDAAFRGLSPALAAVLLLLAGRGAALAGDGQAASSKAEDEQTATSASEDVVSRGKYLVTIAGCNDCHTPLKMGANGPELDTARMLSGHPRDLEMPAAPRLPEGPWQVSVAGTNTAWAGPWGVSFTANLTPDPETGLGKWTLRNFVETIRTGRRMGRGRPILPPMPIPMYKHMTDEDLAAIFAYLQTIPPVSNKVPSPRLPEGAAAL